MKNRVDFNLRVRQNYVALVILYILILAPIPNTYDLLSIFLISKFALLFVTKIDNT